MPRYYGKDEATGQQNILLWVSPGAIRYDREDIDFLLPWLADLREGIGPAEPESGYIGGDRVGVKARAYYEAWTQVAAEIDNRLVMCGLDRYLVEDYYCAEWPPGYDEDDKCKAIAGRVNMQPWEVTRRINSAVSYIASGPCPRWLNCIDCPLYKTCRRKKRVGISYRQWRRSRSRPVSAERR